MLKTSCSNLKLNLKSEVVIIIISFETSMEKYINTLINLGKRSLLLPKYDYFASHVISFSKAKLTWKIPQDTFILTLRVCGIQFLVWLSDTLVHWFSWSYFLYSISIAEEGAQNLEPDRFGPEMRFSLLLGITDMDRSQRIVSMDLFSHLQVCGKDENMCIKNLVELT